LNSDAPAWSAPFPISYQKMPNKSKSRNNSRKSTASSQGKPAVLLNDDGYPSVVVINKPTTSRKSTPKSKESSLDSPRPEFLEPLSPNPITPPPTPWEHLGMHEGEYHAMMQRVQAMYRVMDRESYQQALLDDLNHPWFWKDRIEHLESEREYFNKKWGWSAADILCVEKIDEQIQECEIELDRIYAEEDRLEAEYD